MFGVVARGVVNAVMGKVVGLCMHGVVAWSWTRRSLAEEMHILSFSKFSTSPPSAEMQLVTPLSHAPLAQHTRNCTGEKGKGESNDKGERGFAGC